MEIAWVRGGALRGCSENAVVSGILDRNAAAGHTYASVNEAATDDRAPAHPSAEESDRARRAGAGVITIGGAKLYFLLAGYASQLFLPGLLGSPEAFGLFSAVLSIVSILNNVLVSATVQVVSKRVSENPPRAKRSLRQALELQLIVSVLLGGSLFGCAPLLATILLDPLLTPLFRIAALIVMAYALYAAPIGYLNGLQNFLGQARFDIAYTTLRVGGMLGAAALGFGAAAVLGGFAGAALTVLLAAILIVGTGQRGERTPWKGWLQFMAPLWLYQLCLNLILQIDTTLLKRSVAAALQADGAALEVAAETASRYVGFYRAAQTFAFVPYQLILAVPFVIFPMVSEALSKGDEVGARRYIRASLRLSLIALLSLAAPFAGAAPAVMRLVYPPAYLAGAPALAVLALGMVSFALFVISATIMSSAGRPGTAAGVAVLAVATVIAANLGLVHYVGVGDYTLAAAASGTSLGAFVALAAIGGSLYARFRTFLPGLTVLRSLLAAAAAFFAAGSIPPSSKLMALVALAAGAIAYFAVLIATRELTRADLTSLLAMRKRKRA